MLEDIITSDLFMDVNTGFFSEDESFDVCVAFGLIFDNLEIHS